MGEFDMGNVAGYVLVALLVFSLYYVAATITDSSNDNDSIVIEKEAEEIREELMSGLDDISEKLDEIGDVVNE